MNKIKILFSEDDVFLVEVYKNKFSQAGYEVEAVLDRSQLIEMARVFKPDMIFFDILYDNTPGFDTLKTLSTDPETSAIPIVALTNLRKEEDRKKALEAGAKDYFSKPDTSLEKMLAVTEETLNLKMCPQCHEKVKVKEGKCVNCGSAL